MLGLEQLIKVRLNLTKIAQEAATTTEELVNVGQANRPDLLQANSEFRRQRVALSAAENRHRSAWADLAAFVGCPNLPPTSLSGSLEQDRQIFDWDSTLAHLLQASPEVQVARAEVARNQCGLAREQVEPIPNLRLRTATQYNFATNDQQASVQLGVSVPLWDKNQGNVRAAQSELARSQAEVRRIELSLQRRLAEVFNRYQTAINTVEEYRKHVLPQEGEAYKLYLESYRTRRAAWPQVLVAQRTYVQANLEYLAALVEVRRLEVALAGLLLVDGLDEPPSPPGERRVEQSADRQLEDQLDRSIRPHEGRGPNERFGSMLGE